MNLKIVSVRISPEIIIDRLVDIDSDDRVFSDSRMLVKPKTPLGNRTCSHIHLRSDIDSMADLGSSLSPIDPWNPHNRYKTPSFYGRALSISDGDLPYSTKYPGGNTTTEYSSSTTNNSLQFVSRWSVDKSNQWQITEYLVPLVFPFKSSEAQVKIVDSDGSSSSFSSTLNLRWRDPSTVFPPLTIASIENDAVLWEHLGHLRSCIDAKTPSIGDLSLSAMKTFTPSPNSISFLLELKDISQPLRAVNTFFRDSSAKNLANAYLANEYGTRQTAKDVYSYISQFIRQNNHELYRKVHARHQDYLKILDISCKHYTVLTGYTQNRDHFLLEAVTTLREHGFMPSVGIAWDLIPLSFVVDWFVPIGKLLELFDSKGIFETYSWFEHILTKKYVYEIPSNRIRSGSTGVVRYTTYSRMCDSGMPAPSFEFDDLNFSYRRILNGGAIAFQKWKVK